MVGVDGDKVDLSLRASRTGESVKGVWPATDTTSDPEISSLEDVPEGMVVRGYVKAVTKMGAFVQ